jgi:hypothetical protein
LLTLIVDVFNRIATAHLGISVYFFVSAYHALTEYLGKGTHFCLPVYLGVAIYLNAADTDNAPRALRLVRTVPAQG